MDNSLLTTELFVCNYCGKNIIGYQVLTDVVNDNINIGASDIIAFQCEGCNSIICATCRKEKININLWKGLADCKCPKCGHRFGPKMLILRSNTEKYKLDSLQKSQEEATAGISRNPLDVGRILIYVYILIVGILSALNSSNEFIRFGIIYSSVGILICLLPIIIKRSEMELIKILFTLGLDVFFLIILGFNISYLNPVFIILFCIGLLVVIGREIYRIEKLKQRRKNLTT